MTTYIIIALMAIRYAYMFDLWVFDNQTGKRVF